MPSGITSANIVSKLINQTSEDYLRVLPMNLGKKAREMAQAGFRDGMRTAFRHLEQMEVISIIRD